MLEILKSDTKSSEIQGFLVAKLEPMIWWTEVANSTWIRLTTRLWVAIQIRWFVALIDVSKEAGRYKIARNTMSSDQAFVIRINVLVYLYF